MRNLEEFHLDSSSSVAMFECIEVSHSLWPEPLRYVANNVFGITTINEDGQQVTYQYMPIKISKGSTADNLNQKISIIVGDLGAVVPPLLKLIKDADSREAPKVIYRAFASNDLSRPMDMIVGLEVIKMNRDYQGTTFEAAASGTNYSGTGVTATVELLPSLKAFY